MAVKTSTRDKKGLGRKRVSKQNNKITGFKFLKTSSEKITFLGSKFLHSYNLVTSFMFLLSIFSFLSILHKAGPVGEYLFDSLSILFGYGTYAFPLILLYGSLILFRDKDSINPQRVFVGSIYVLMTSTALFHALIHTNPQPFEAGTQILKNSGGYVSSFIAYPLHEYLGPEMTKTILLFGLIYAVIYMTDIHLQDLVTGIQAIMSYSARFVYAFFKARRELVKLNLSSGYQEELLINLDQEPDAQYEEKKKKTPKNNVRNISDHKQNKLKKKNYKNKTKTNKTITYKKPPLKLLKSGNSSSTSKKLLQNTAADLTVLLSDHGVDAEITNIVPGPTVTRYEVELKPGVKVSRVTSLSHDIAYTLGTPEVRLLAPIPGRSAIGIEIPNRQRKLVTLGDVMKSSDLNNSENPLEIGLGLDISGKPMTLNIADLPHVLIAGQTGSGKSSCINSIVSSLLINTDPEEVKMIMVDPKRVELGQYNGIPHLLTKVITNPKKAVDALSWAVTEMDRRYDLLADGQVRDITGYHEKYDAGLLDTDKFDRFPYIVLFIDELNDLMMVAGREVESSIVRIAQMARAIGIHLVVATQRPSVDVITGVMKANIPSRLAFSVASTTDSRVILDQAGAEKLIGSGDFLIVTASNPRIERIQAAWITEVEIKSIVKWAKDQKNPEYNPAVIEESKSSINTSDDTFGEDEELINSAKDLVIRSQMGSTSMLQRKLRIGFARAGRIMDILEANQIVGPSVGSKPREVLITVEEYDNKEESELVE